MIENSYQESDVIINLFQTIVFLYILQMVANAVLFLSVNVAGVFIHNVTQRSQRKTFMETRNCIAARHDIEDENEKLVKNK